MPLMAEATLGASKIQCPEDDGAFAQQALNSSAAARLDDVRCSSSDCTCLA